MPIKILISVPSAQAKGGVAQFYNALLPHLPNTIKTVEIGGTKGAGGILHPLVDQVSFRRTVKQVQPRVIHLNPSMNLKSYIRDGLFAWQAKQMRVPLLIFWHGWDKDFESVVEKKYLSFFRRTFGLAKGHIVLASEFKQKLRDWGVTAPIYRETTNVDDSLIAGFNVLQKWSEPAPKIDTVHILFLARLERAKGVFETVQAIKLLLARKLPVALTIAGEGVIRTELEEYVKSLELTSEHIRFTGDIRGADKIRAFAEHHIYCFPTFYGEGMPTSVLEAMAFGMPVVTRPVGGLTDIFEDGRMGRLVKGKKPEEIADCLEQLIRDRDKMKRIGLYNAAYAKEHFMASKVAKRLLNIYDKMAGL